MTGCSESFRPACEAMLRLASGHTFAPHPKRRRFQFCSHQGNHLSFRQAELSVNRVEGCAVFPGHFDDPVDLIGGRGAHQPFVDAVMVSIPRVNQWASRCRHDGCMPIRVWVKVGVVNLIQATAVDTTGG